MLRTVLVFCVCGFVSLAAGQTTVFTYQGRLENGGTPADGPHDFRFRLFNAIVEGNQVGTTQCVNDVNVTDGLFTVNLNFGEQFISAARFLEIDVRADTGQDCTNATGYTLLGPRSQIHATPIATHAIAAYRLDAPDGSPSGVVTVSDNGNTFVSGFLGVSGNISTSGNANVSGNALIDDFVGIGTNAPERTLHIDAVEPVLILQDSTPDTSQQSGYVGFWNNGPSETAWMGYGTPGSPDFSIVNARFQGDVVFWALGSGGNVGIEVDDPEFLLHVAGTAGKPGGGSWSVASDVRLKKNIRPLDSALERMLALRGVTYEYINPEMTHELPGVQMGMIAQEVEAVFPDWVDEGRSGFKRLTFRGFEALTVEAMREMRSAHDADANKLRAEIANLREENTDLRRRLELLEAALARLVR
ncbi:MAG: tail fiber domain-containing protein [Phycisphaerales bacterium]|nr:tail fiber domain-containing protein [Phycisphaerales bacterium]